VDILNKYVVARKRIEMKCSLERSKDSQYKRYNRQQSFGASFEKGDNYTRNNPVPELVVKPETRKFEPVLGPKKICRDCQQSHCSDELPSYRTVYREQRN